jgi:hypothetical protein
MLLSLIPSMGHRTAGTLVAAIFLIAALMSAPVEAASVAVRHPEGVAHGFLLVRSLVGEIIGQGEMTQVIKESGLVESHLVFRFKDGSLSDETVAFSQQRVFTMLRYRLVQRGPSFPEQIDVSLDRGTAEYKVRSKAGEHEKEKVLTGHVDLPQDAYNGMLVMVLRNLPKGANETVKILAFTPTPEVINLQLRAVGDHTVHIGNLSRMAQHYAFKPQIGMIRKFFGRVFGKLPADFHYDCWILADEVPAFVQFEGPLHIMGPIVRIELVSPRLSAQPEDKRRPAP